MRLNLPSIAAGLSLSLATPALAEDLKLPENKVIRAQVALALKTLRGQEPTVETLPAGTYRGQVFVLAHTSAQEASSPATWQYELDVAERLLENPPVLDELDCPDDAAYRKIDSKPLERFLEPGSTFQITGARGAGGEVQVYLVRAEGPILTQLWLNANLPASCFATSWKEPSREVSPPICFVPLSGHEVSAKQ